MRPLRRSLRPGGFSLVELLCTMGVIVLLLAVALPAVRGWRSSSARSAAVGQVLALLNEARATALEKGRPTYFVISDHAPSSQGDGSWSAMALYQQPQNADELPRQITRWHRLPAGCSFINPEGEPSALAASPSASDWKPTFLQPGRSEPSALPYLAFGDTGRLLHPSRSQEARLLLSTQPEVSPDIVTVALFTGRSRCEW